MKINCVSCGHNMALDDAYDDFEGLIKCYVCGALLHVKNCDAKVKSVHLAGQQSQRVVKQTKMDIKAAN